MDFSSDANGKEPTYQSGRHKRCGFDPWVRKILCRRKWQPTPVFLPGESQVRGSLVGCRLWGSRVGHDGSDLAAAAAGRLSGSKTGTFLAYWNIVAAAAAKSLQSCPSLCDPIDSSPLGSSVPVILQARTLEWVAIYFSNA